MTKIIKERLKQYNEFEKSIRPKIPKNMLIELTNRCNDKCIFCYNRKAKRVRGEISEKFLVKILNEGYNEGVREVGYYATGEPFMCKKLPDYIKIAKDIGYEYVYITTNGALATKESLKEIINNGLDSIKFSINAGTRETYRKIHGFDDFDKVIENLRFLSDYRKSNDLKFKIYVSYVVTKTNIDEIEILKNIARKYVDDIVFTNVRNQGGLMYEINETLALDEDKYSKYSIPCSLLFNCIHVTYEGYMTICCVDFENDLVVADLNKNSLRDGWYNEKFTVIRKRHIENDLKETLCYRCVNNINESYKKL